MVKKGEKTCLKDDQGRRSVFTRKEFYILLDSYQEMRY